MVAARYDIHINNGTDWDRTFTLLDAADNPIDVSAAPTKTVSLYDHKTRNIIASPAITLAVGGADNNVVTISQTDTVSATLTEPVYAWVLIIEETAGKKKHWVAGEFHNHPPGYGFGAGGPHPPITRELPMASESITIRAAALPDTAASVGVTDTAGHFVGTNVETVLAELADGTTLDARYANVTGDTFTGDVSIAKASPILTIDASTGPAKIIVDAAAGQAGFYYFYEDGVYKGAFLRNSAGRAYYTDAVTGRVLDLHTAAGAFDATAMESALMPQPLDGSTEGAARVTAASSTTGQHTINGQVGGDTGLHTILSWTAGVQDASDQLATIPLGTFSLAGTGSVRLRRQGPWVQLSFPSSPSNGITPLTTSPQYLLSTNSLPNGFRLANSITVPLAYYNQSGVANVSGVGNIANPMIYTAVAETLYRGSAVWYTTDAWPTSLPGVQVNAPFSL